MVRRWCGMRWRRGKRWLRRRNGKRVSRRRSRRQRASRRDGGRREERRADHVEAPYSGHGRAAGFLAGGELCCEPMGRLLLPRRDAVTPLLLLLSPLLPRSLWRPLFCLFPGRRRRCRRLAGRPLLQRQMHGLRLGNGPLRLAPLRSPPLAISLCVSPLDIPLLGLLRPALVHPEDDEAEGEEGDAGTDGCPRDGRHSGPVVLVLLVVIITDIIRLSR